MLNRLFHRSSRHSEQPAISIPSVPESLLELAAGLRELPAYQSSGGIAFVYVAQELRKLWDPTWTPSIQFMAIADWGLNLTQEFRKNIKNIDRKLQGRLLEALSEIAANPVKLRGDTVKPLTGPMKGYWRYRLGDHRMIYLPDEARKNVIVICFMARGDVYEETAA